MIHEFVVFLSRLAGLIKENDPEFLQLELDRSYQLYTGYDGRFMMTLSCEDLQRLLGDRPEILLIAGLIMKEQATAFYRSGQDLQYAVKLLEKSICLRRLMVEQPIPDLLKKQNDLKGDRAMLQEWLNVN